MSQASSRKNNALIEKAALDARQKMGKVIDAESFTANVIKMSNYQANPLAATLHTRTLGLAKVHVTPDQIK